MSGWQYAYGTFMQIKYMHIKMSNLCMSSGFLIKERADLASTLMHDSNLPLQKGHELRKQQHKLIRNASLYIHKKKKKKKLYIYIYNVIYILPICTDHCSFHLEWTLEAVKRLGYVCNPRSLKEGTETSRRMTDEIGISPESPIHFKCN